MDGPVCNRLCIYSQINADVYVYNYYQNWLHRVLRSSGPVEFVCDACD